ncbi:MAG: hypothetical protein SF339_26310 [Blastocatellia bacterium]|nr:hypothetical protein [Blastocatellia bacterium]
MRAVIVATGESEREILSEERLNCLLPLMDRPFIEHVVERLGEAGIDEVDVILSNLAEQVEAALGDGARWGCRIRYHLAADAARPYEALKMIAHDALGRVLLAHAERLPVADLSINCGDRRAGGPVLYYSRKTSGALSIDEPSWTGWGWIPAEQLLSLSASLDEAGLELNLLAAAAEAGRVEKVETVHSARSCEALLTSQYEMLNRGGGAGLSQCREIAPGIWIGRHSRVHPQANLFAPLLIDDYCQIEAGAVIGPNAVIGHGSLIECGSVLEDALVLPQSYVGEGLHLKQTVIAGRRLYSARNRMLVDVADRAILDDLAPAPLAPRLAGALSWGLALLLFLATAPLVGATWLFLKLRRGGRVWHTRTVVSGAADGPIKEWSELRLRTMTEAPESGNRWRIWLFMILPALFHVLRGDLRLFGIRPRTHDELARLTGYWRRVYCQQPIGLIQLGGDPVDEDWPLDLLGAVAAEMSS